MNNVPAKRVYLKYEKERPRHSLTGTSLMYFQHVYDKSLAQGSYFIGCQHARTAVVIDPKRDVDTYLEIAKENNMDITHVVETHIHADFLCGSRELASLTGAKLYLSDEGGPDWQYEFSHSGLKDGDIFMVGNLQFDVIHTPGHTPESISLLLTDRPASDQPVMLFTGDFIFVGDVGRPDLLEIAAGMSGTIVAGAKEMFASVQKFMALSDHIQVWPGHGAGSACGKALGAVPSTTVGYEKIRNVALRYAHDEGAFTKYLLEDQPEPPTYFSMMKRLNKVDRPLLTKVPVVQKLSITDLKNALDDGMKVIDTRPKNEFANGFIPGTINIQGNNFFSTWMGWLMSYEEPFILIASEPQLEDLVRKLMRIGMDRIYGYVAGTGEWEKANGPLLKADLISLEEFEDILMTNHTRVVDLRGYTEYKAGHIEGTENIFVGALEHQLHKLAKDEPIVVHCQSGDRAAIGYSLLRKHGFSNIRNYAGGMTEWLRKDKPTIIER